MAQPKIQLVPIFHPEQALGASPMIMAFGAVSVSPDTPPSLPEIHPTTLLSADLSQTVHARPRPNSLLPPGPLPRRAGAVRARRKSWTHTGISKPPTLHVEIPSIQTPEPVEIDVTTTSSSTNPVIRRHSDPPTASPWTGARSELIDLWASSDASDGDGEGFKEAVAQSSAYIPDPLRLSTVSPLVVSRPHELPSSTSTTTSNQSLPYHHQQKHHHSTTQQLLTPPSSSSSSTTSHPTPTFTSILNPPHIIHPLYPSPGLQPTYIITPPQYIDDRPPAVALELRSRLDEVLRNWGAGTSPGGWRDGEGEGDANGSGNGKGGFMAREERELSWFPEG